MWWLVGSAGVALEPSCDALSRNRVDVLETRAGGAFSWDTKNPTSAKYDQRFLPHTVSDNLPLLWRCRLLKVVEKGLLPVSRLPSAAYRHEHD